MSYKCCQRSKCHNLETVILFSRKIRQCTQKNNVLNQVVTSAECCFNNYSMFRDFPGCSGMFRNVPCSGFYRRPILYGLWLKYSNFYNKRLNLWPVLRLTVLKQCANKHTDSGNCSQMTPSYKSLISGKEIPIIAWICFTSKR